MMDRGRSACSSVHYQLEYLYPKLVCHSHPPPLRLRPPVCLCRYEGLVKDEVADLRGVFTHNNGDRYEGEFIQNLMEGYGVYIWKQEGTLYRGEWKNSMMHGCGVKITRQPNGQFIAEEGFFQNDEWMGNGEDVGCTIQQAQEAASQADTAAKMARAFELSPANEALLHQHKQVMSSKRITKAKAKNKKKNQQNGHDGKQKRDEERELAGEELGSTNPFHTLFQGLHRLLMSKDSRDGATVSEMGGKS